MQWIAAGIQNEERTLIVFGRVGIEDYLRDAIFGQNGIPIIDLLYECKPARLGEILSFKPVYIGSGGYRVSLVIFSVPFHLIVPCSLFLIHQSSDFLSQGIVDGKLDN